MGGYSGGGGNEFQISSAIGFLRNSGWDHHKEAIGKQLDPMGSNVSRGRFVWPSVKHIDG